MTNTKVNAIQELRRGNAATAVPSKKVRKERDRRSQERASISRSMRGE